MKYSNYFILLIIYVWWSQENPMPNPLDQLTLNINVHNDGNYGKLKKMDEEHDSDKGSQDKNPVWVKQEGLDCYNGHGATEITPEPHSKSMSLDICKAACRTESTCEAIIRSTADQQNIGKCYLRKNLNIQDCKTATSYTLHYIKTGGGQSQVAPGSPTGGQPPVAPGSQTGGQSAGAPGSPTGGQPPVAPGSQTGQPLSASFNQFLQQQSSSTGQSKPALKRIEPEHKEEEMIERFPVTYKVPSKPECANDKKATTECKCGNAQCGVGNTCIEEICLQGGQSPVAPGPPKGESSFTCGEWNDYQDCFIGCGEKGGLCDKVCGAGGFCCAYYGYHRGECSSEVTAVSMKCSIDFSQYVCVTPKTTTNAVEKSEKRR